MTEQGEISTNLGTESVFEIDPDIHKAYFIRDASRILRDASVPQDVLRLVPNELWNTFKTTKDSLGIEYPIIMRPSELILHGKTLLKHPDSITMAFFQPTIVDDKIVQGDLIINESVLAVYSGQIVRRGERRPFTPWKLIGDIAHEMKHAGQYQEDVVRVLDDGKYPYESREIELEANVYARDYIKKREPWSVVDRIERSFVVADLNKDIKRIRDNVRNRD